MIAKIDKFLIDELRERGFDIEYKELVEIYQASRKRTDCIKRKARNKAINEIAIELRKRELETKYK